MKRVAGALACVLLLPVLVGGAAIGGGITQAPDQKALRDIPAEYARLYFDAAAKYRIPWELLAAVGKVECDHGRGDCYRPNEAGAMGPMQFMPGTWPAYRTSSGEPPYSVYDARDAVYAAAAKLAADNVRTNPGGALYAYNQSNAYVNEVFEWALKYGWIPVDPELLAKAVLRSPNIDLRPEARADVARGLVDARVLAALLHLSAHHDLGWVGPFVSGHTVYVAGTTRVSNHAVGRAVDIPIVDGLAVSTSNAGAREVTERLLTLPGALLPDEVGAPWHLPAEGVEVFTDGHGDHIHLGYSS